MAEDNAELFVPERNDKRADSDPYVDTDSAMLCMIEKSQLPPRPLGDDMFMDAAKKLAAQIKRTFDDFSAREAANGDWPPPTVDSIEDLIECASCGCDVEAKNISDGLCLNCIPKCNRCGMPNFWHKQPLAPELPFGDAGTCVLCRKLCCPFYERCRQFKDRVEDKGCAQCACKNCGLMFLSYTRPRCPTRRGWCLACALKFACSSPGCSEYADPKLGDGGTCQMHYKPFCSISYCTKSATRHLNTRPYRGYCDEHTIRHGRKRQPCCYHLCTSGLRAINGASSPCFECVCQVEGCYRVSAPHSPYCTLSHKRCPGCKSGQMADHEELCRECSSGHDSGVSNPD